MIAYRDIRSVHLELSTRCNAVCPDCPRNFRGVDIVDTYPITELRLSDIKQIMPEQFIQQLTNVLINGNYGDFVTARDGLAIVEYLLDCNELLNIEISTNASAKPGIWKPLGDLGVTVDFRLDGLADTHSLYRQNTDWDLIIRNAQEFIKAGGIAVWAMIKFDHNQHQIAACREMASNLGFNRFWLVDNGRNTFPVFTTDRRLSHIIGDYTGSTNFDELYSQFEYNAENPMEVVANTTDDYKIDCYSIKNQEIYINAAGEVYPCCWLGYYPNHGTARTSNTQLIPIMSNNNALQHGLETAVGWFNKIEDTWDKTVPAGKIFACNDTCGIR